MELFDLQKHERNDVLQAVLNKGTSKFQLTYDDRALQFSAHLSLRRKNRAILKYQRQIAGVLLPTTLVLSWMKTHSHPI
ncbi:signal transduction protein [Citrobacter freundii]|nr:signal transduction protein [Citrobacter freundii]